MHFKSAVLEWKQQGFALLKWRSHAFLELILFDQGRAEGDPCNHKS